jgi:hypothetical protein
MKLTVKGFVGLLAALLLAVLGGWIWGAGDRSHTDDALVQAGVGLQMANARARMLEARVDLFEVNFGNASRHLEAARADLKTAAQSLDRLGRTGDAAAVRDALARVDAAQQLTGKLDQTANARLAEAVDLLPKTP